MIVLTSSERGSFHEAVEAMGIKAFSYVVPRKPSWRFFLRHIRYLIGFCRRNKIDSVWSHLQEANLIALFAQPFLKAKVVAFRHHAESAFYAEMGALFGLQRNKNEERVDKIINRRAKKIVVPSSGVWYCMEKFEGCDMRKVKLIPYIYDFSTYAKPDEAVVRSLREKYPCSLMLIMVSRMIATKQHMPVFEIVQKLVAEGLSVKMIVMDDGALRPQLEQFIRDHQLEQHIILVGFKPDFVNYMAASDLLMHPSLTEASNNVVKEMGLLQKAVAVCEGVGDFNDYIEDGINGFMIDRKYLKPSMEAIIRRVYNDKALMQKAGAALQTSVMEMFSDSEKNRKRFTELI